MTITEMIHRLEILWEEHGDLEVKATYGESAINIWYDEDEKDAWIEFGTKPEII